jgi:murein DD-endopeptidase MepM/ murein hydrolase activator NlpD
MKPLPHFSRPSAKPAKTRCFYRLVSFVPCALTLLSSAFAVSGSTRAQPTDQPLANDVGSGAENSLDTSALLDQIDKESAEKNRLEKEAIAINANRVRTREALRSQTRVLYRLTRAGILPLSGGVDALMIRATQLERFKHLVRADIERIRQLEKRSALAERQSAQLSTSLEQVRARLAELHKRPLVLPKEPSAIQNATASAGEELSFRGQNGDRGFYGLRVVDAKPESAFAREKGNLAIPVSGEFAVRDAQRDESDGPGLEFLARAGTTVRAAAAGRVAFSDIYGSYGRLVILDHGDNYYTVYGGLGNVDVRVGDDLSRSARIGTVASNRTESALFFEIRRGTRSLPPRGWLGL